MMSACPTYVFVLEPEAAFGRWIEACKRRVRALVGDQLYLDHPPHVTLYVAAFPPKADLGDPTAQLARRLAAPRAVMDRWHVFQTDPLTGRHTLVCEVPAESRPEFGRLQEEVIGTLAPMRDLDATRARYDAAWEQLSTEERTNVILRGFPFVGPLWRAHVTVASIRPADWPAVTPLLEEKPPGDAVGFTHLARYALENGHMGLVERFALGDQAAP